MAVFTYIATAIVTAVTGAAVVAGTWAAFAVSVIATGLAAVTSRLIGGPGARGGGGTQDQGVRIQLPPATENKIPVIYGRAYQQPIITDARISSSGGSTQDTMTYVLTLSEKTTSGAYTFNDVYWNDQKLNFDTDGCTVISSITADGSTSTTLAGLVKVYAFAGGSSSTYNVSISGGTVPAVNAYDLLPQATSDYQMSDLIFAVVQLTYSSEKGVTGLPSMTFDITNSLSNPGLVWYDYLTNTRYGCGFTTSTIDTITSINTASTASLYSISNEIPPNQFNNDSTTSTQARYVINGVLNTGDTVKNNLERINLASSSWTTFDHKSGLWKIVVNRAATAGEIAAAQHFTDDTIIGEITLTSTNLEDLYNAVEVEYANRNTRDQSDYYKASIDSSLRNQLEPDNQMRMRLDLVNNKIHAGRIGQIELKQSRFDLLITFTADYTALQTEVGDVIKVSNPIYDFTEKLFRVTRVRETEGEDGVLAAEITALQYDATVYTDETQTDAADKPNINVPSAGSSEALPSPGAPVLTNTNPISDTPYFTIATTLATTSTPITVVEWWYSTATSGSYTYLTNEHSVGGFVSGSTVTDNIYSLNAGTYYFRARAGSGGLYSPLSTTSSSFTWNPTITVNSQTVITTASLTWQAILQKTGPSGPSKIGVGLNAQAVNSGTNTVAIGAYAGYSTQTQESVAIGLSAGQYQQGYDATGIFPTTDRYKAVAIGASAGQTNQQFRAVAVGAKAGMTNQGYRSVAVGEEAGEVDQSYESVAIGWSAGANTQREEAVAVGKGAGGIFQGTASIAIGHGAATNYQGQYGIAIGEVAAAWYQKDRAIAIGYYAGEGNSTQYQRQDAIAIGSYAGRRVQGQNAVAIGFQAGYTTQTSYAIAIGDNAGYSRQLGSAVAIGRNAGYSVQAADCIAIGRNAGYTNQQGIAIGLHAGYNTQIGGIAIGNYAGETTQGYYSIAVGDRAGNITQGEQCIAIGTQAALNTQSNYSIAIGASAARNTQQAYSVAIGFNAGHNNQQPYSVAIGFRAGYTSQTTGSIILSAGATALQTATNAGLYISPILPSTATQVLYYNTATKEVTYGDTTSLIGPQGPQGPQGATGPQGPQGPSGPGNTWATLGDKNNASGPQAIALGYLAGSINQSTTGTIAIGVQAGESNQSRSSVAIGEAAGQTSQGQESVALGDSAGAGTQGLQAVAVGYAAGNNTQSNYAVAIGTIAGYQGQGVSSVAVGGGAGADWQGNYSVAIGNDAGRISQAGSSIAVGSGAGNTSQGASAVSIGESAGQNNQGGSSIAIGKAAGQTNQAANSIILNATGSALNNTTTSGLFIAPIAQSTSSQVLYYNTTTKEVSYGAAPSGSGGITQAQAEDIAIIYAIALGG